MFWGHLSVCLYVCWYARKCNCRKPRRRKFTSGVRRTVKFLYEDHRVNVKVITAKKIGNKSGSTEDSAVKFACSVGYWAMADRMTPSLSRDRKCTHSRVVCLRLEGNLVVSLRDTFAVSYNVSLISFSATSCDE